MLKPEYIEGRKTAKVINKDVITLDKIKNPINEFNIFVVIITVLWGVALSIWDADLVFRTV
jgi:hypothetical protein